MKKLNQLLIVEADENLPPLLSQHAGLFAAFSKTSVAVRLLNEINCNDRLSSPELLVLHSNLTTTEHLQNFVRLQEAYPHTSIIIISQQQDEEICLLALEAGADDSVVYSGLTPTYLCKAVLLALRRQLKEKELSYSQEQLLACIQNTPNVAVQWYNNSGEVLFWNQASERIFGWTAAEAVGKPIDALIVIPQNKNFWLDKIKRMANGELAETTKEWRFLHRDGTEGYCLSTLFPIPSFNHHPWFACMDVDITSLKQMEGRLQQSEERYHVLFNQASDAIFINDVSGRFLEMNEKACELCGYSKEALIRLSVPNIYSEEELAARPIMWAELLRGERTCLERNLLCASGKEVPVEVTAQMLTDGRIMAILRDISGRKKTEEALRQSEEKYRSLVEQQADAIAIFDETGQILDVNTSATQMLYYTKEQLRTMRLENVLSAEEMAKDPLDFTLLGTGDSSIKQRQLLRKNGTLVETEVHTKRLFDGLFLASVRDLTERIQVQHQLQKEIELSESIINSLPGLFYLFTKEGKYLRWNRQQEEVSGYSTAEISRMDPLDFFDDEEKPIINASIEEVFATGASSTEALFFTKSGKKIPYYFTGIAVNYAGTVCLLGTGIDLSTVKSLEQELSWQKIAEQKRVIQAMIDAEEKERNKLGLELHDNVNQILSVVRMYLAILNSSQPLQEVTLPKAIALLNTAIDEIRHLSHSLAVTYKFETGLAGTLQEMVEKVQTVKDFAVSLVVDPELDTYTNSQQKLALYRIVQEQLSNIIKYAKAKTVTINITLTGDEIQLHMADDGKGFDMATVQKGLGLNTIANRAEALEGKAVVSSAPGMGCRLELTLPLQPVDSEE